MEPIKELEIVYRDEYSKYCRYMIKQFKITWDLAEDIVQDSFVKAVDNIDYYDPAKGSMAGWLYRITFNVAINYYNKSNTRLGGMHKLFYEKSEPIFREGVDELIIKKDISDKFKDSIQESLLDQKAEDIIYLWLQGESQDSIGKKIGVKRHIIRSVIGKDLKKLTRKYKYSRCVL